MTQRLLLSFVVCHLLAACEQRSPSPPPDDRDARYAELAQLYGEMGAACWPVSLLFDGQSASPTSDAASRAQTETALAKAMAELLAADTVTVDDDTATACLEALRDRDGCAEIPPFGEPVACEGLTTGKQNEGDPCGTPAECSGDLLCTGFDACGTCETPRADGEACGANGLCGLESRCVEGVCAPILPASPRLEIGQACPAADTCDSGLACVGGICEPLVLVGRGETCGVARLCVDEGTTVSCLPVDEAGWSSERICKRLPGVGESCARFRECDSTVAVCDETGQCVPGGREGDPCSSDFDCLRGLELGCHLTEGRCGPIHGFLSPAACEEN